MWMKDRQVLLWSVQHPHKAKALYRVGCITNTKNHQTQKNKQSENLFNKQLSQSSAELAKQYCLADSCLERDI